jgi:hypothetical protein
MRSILSWWICVTNSEMIDGQYVDHVRDDFKPIMSLSNLINGTGHRRAAEKIAESTFASLQKIFPGKGADAEGEKLKGSCLSWRTLSATGDRCRTTKTAPSPGCSRRVPAS